MRSRVHALALVASIAFAACEDEDDDASSASDGGVSDAGGTGGAGTGGAGTGGAGTGGAGTGGAGTGGGDPSRCDDGSAIPGEQPSTRTVTLVVRNDSDEMSFVTTAGFACGPFGIERVMNGEATSVPLGFPVACALCQGPPAHCDGIGSGPIEMVPLAPGESTELVWDGRGLVLCSSPIEECPSWNSTQKGALQPMAAGDYRFLLWAWSQLPAWCSAPDGGPLECDQSMIGGGGAFVPYVQCAPRMLEEATLVMAPFTLEASGDVETSVSLD